MIFTINKFEVSICKILERNEHSYIGKSWLFFLLFFHEIVLMSNLIFFRGLTYDFFVSSVHFFV